MQKKKIQPRDSEKDADKKMESLPEGVAGQIKPDAKFQKRSQKPGTCPKPVDGNIPGAKDLLRVKNESDGNKDGEGKPNLAEKSSELIPGSPNRRLPLIGAVIGGLVAGFLLGYFVLIIPLQNQIASITEVNSNGDSSSNLMKSDLSTTRLKQQEMEIRYQAASDQLESANQYIFLLRMKEQIAITRLLVEQKEGFKARQSLSEIQNRFEHLKPYVVKKDAATVEKLDELIKVSIQHLASDPESVKTDLTAISDLLNGMETTLFQPEQE